MEITTERVSIPVPGGGAMPAYLARPAQPAGAGRAGDGPYPAVIVWMEIFGVNSHIRDVTERVAREGYVAVAPNFFHRTNPTIDVGYDDAGRTAGIQEMGKLDTDQMIADAQAAVDVAARAPRRHRQARRDGLLHRRSHDLSHRGRDRRRRRGELLRRRHRCAEGPGGKPSPIQRTHKIRAACSLSSAPRTR